MLFLHEALKSLEQRDVRNSKLPYENFEFLCKEILSKDEFIKYLMETQTTALNVVISEKNQRKHKRKYKRQIFHNNSNNRICKDNKYNNIFYVNTALVRINHNLNMKSFNRTADNKIGKGLIPRRN